MATLSHGWPSPLSHQQESKLYQREYNSFKIKACKVDEMGTEDSVLTNLHLK